jgi:hypothetical protein
MANTKTPITIDDVEYQFEDMTQEQQCWSTMSLI